MCCIHTYCACVCECVSLPGQMWKWMMRVLCLQNLMYVTFTQTSKAESQVSTESEGRGVVHTILQKSLHSCHLCLSERGYINKSLRHVLKICKIVTFCGTISLTRTAIPVNICLIVLQEAAKGWTEKRSSGRHMMFSAQSPKWITRVSFTNETASSLNAHCL